MSNGNNDSDREETRILLWMFENEKQNDKQPDFAGPGRIHKHVLRDFVESYKKLGDGEKLSLRCAAWLRTSKSGKPYTFVTIEPEKPRETIQPDDIEAPF